MQELLSKIVDLKETLEKNSFLTDNENFTQARALLRDWQAEMQNAFDKSEAWKLSRFWFNGGQTLAPAEVALEAEALLEKYSSTANGLQAKVQEAAMLLGTFEPEIRQIVETWNFGDKDPFVQRARLWLHLRELAAARSAEELRSATESGHAGLILAASSRARGLLPDAPEALAASEVLKSRAAALQAVSPVLPASGEAAANAERILQAMSEDWNAIETNLRQMRKADFAEIGKAHDLPPEIDGVFEVLAKLVPGSTRDLLRNDYLADVRSLPSLAVNGSLSQPLAEARACWSEHEAMDPETWNQPRRFRAAEQTFFLLQGLFALDDKFKELTETLQSTGISPVVASDLKPEVVKSFVAGSKVFGTAWLQSGGDVNALQGALDAVKAHASRSQAKRDAAASALEEMLTADTSGNDGRSLKQRIQDCILHLRDHAGEADKQDLKAARDLICEPFQIRIKGQELAAPLVHGLEKLLSLLDGPPTNEATAKAAEERLDVSHHNAMLAVLAGMPSEDGPAALFVSQLAEAQTVGPQDGIAGEVNALLSAYRIEYLPQRAAWEAAEAQAWEAEAAWEAAERAFEVAKALAESPSAVDAAGCGKRVQDFGLRGAMTVQEVKQALLFTRHAGASILTSAPGGSATAAEKLKWLGEALDLILGVLSNFEGPLQSLANAAEAGGPPGSSLQAAMLEATAKELGASCKPPSAIPTSQSAAQDAKVILSALLPWYDLGCGGDASKQALYAWIASAVALAPLVAAASELTPIRNLISQAASDDLLEEVRTALGKAHPEEPWWWLQYLGCDSPEAFYQDHGLAPATKPEVPASQSSAEPIIQASNTQPDAAAATNKADTEASATPAAPQDAELGEMPGEGPPQGETVTETGAADPEFEDDNATGAVAAAAVAPGGAAPAEAAKADLDDGFEDEEAAPQPAPAPAKEEDDYGFEAEESQVLDAGNGAAAATNSLDDGFEFEDDGPAEASPAPDQPAQGAEDDEFEAE
mmetsp:Transcript_93014/g.165424  ORF Transcript_93014/g.165424 Transcript_93014/m.165424 type:complete len:993 (+) Transcript_93014:1-2979(+)